MMEERILDALSGIKTQLSMIDGRLSTVETKLTTMDDRLSTVESQLTTLDDKIDGLGEIVVAHSDKLDEHSMKLDSLATNITDVRERVKRIEEGIPEDNKAMIHLFDIRLNENNTNVFLLNNRILQVETQLHQLTNENGNL